MTNLSNKYKIIIVILFLLLLVNPISLFFLTDNLSFSILVSLLNILVGFIIFYKYKSTSLQYLYYTFGFIIFLIINSELLFRINFKEFLINNLYETRDNYYFNKSNLNLVLDDYEYQTIYQTNQYGYRIKDFHSKIYKPDWLFIGDSYTQGAQVNFIELYTTQLSEIIKNKNILNAGISGFSLYEEFELIKNEFKYYNPEIVFIQLCVLNDFELVEKKNQGIKEWLIEKSELYRFLYFNYKSNNQTDKLNGRWVLPFYSNINDNIDYNILYNTTSENKLEILNSMKFYLKEISVFLKKHNSKMVVILIPTKEQVYPDYLNEVLVKFNIDSANINILNSSKYIIDNSQEIGFDVIDPIFEFQEDTSMLYFKNDEHLNEIGHKKLSEIIASYILTRKFK